jgi:hypothetical protein
MKEPSSINDATTEIVNIVYAATIQFFERLEGRRLRGNGHHMAQDVAAAAVKLVQERWIDEQPNTPINGERSESAA